MIHDNISEINRRFDKVTKIAKYDPICGSIWPTVCQFGRWNTEILLHSSEEYLDKILSMLEEMYGETMSVESDDKFCNLYLDFFCNNKTVML